MKRLSLFFLSFSFIAIFSFAGCKKSSDNPVGSVTTYPVTVTVLNPAGQPQGGALVKLKNPPYVDASFEGYTDSSGLATIKSPEGAQTITAQIGSAFLSEVQINVKPTTNPQQNIAPPIKLQQNTSVKVLVVKASAEELEEVLRDPKIGFTTFDEIDIDALRDSSEADSTKLLNYLKKYSLIFSDCHGGTEGGDDYAILSRTYGRYVQGGGKMYGGHYNYYHLQRVWNNFYQKENTKGDPSNDEINIVDNDLYRFVGFKVAKWSGDDYRNLSGYEKFDDLPQNAKVYGIINGITPNVAVIVENHVGTGKYLWTDYHNQDIKNDPKLIKLVQYFLLSL